MWTTGSIAALFTSSPGFTRNRGGWNGVGRGGSGGRGSAHNGANRFRQSRGGFSTQSLF